MAEQGSSIRLAVLEDATAIAALHVRAWQWAYRDLVPDEYLDHLTDRLPQREQRWEEWLSKPEPGVHTWVIEWRGSVAGFAGTGPSRDHPAGSGVGELQGIYLDPSATGIGLGRALMAHAMEVLRGQGYRRAILWVLEGNARARRFYEKAGWHPDGQSKVEQRQGFELREVRYEVDLSGAGGTMRT